MLDYFSSRFVSFYQTLFFPRLLYCRMSICSISLSVELTFRWTISVVSKTSKSCWRRGGLMVRALDSGWSSLGWSPGVCWAGHVTLTVSLSTQVNNWVPVVLRTNLTMD